MALLQKVRTLSNERLDLPDFRNLSDFVCADLKAIFKNSFTNENFVISGFFTTGTGSNILAIELAGSSALFGKDDGAMYIGASNLASLTYNGLTPSATNYVELYLEEDTGGADVRAFWDPTANSGQGAEFSQIVDTFTFTKVSLYVNTGSFTGDSNKIQICEVDTDGSGVITAIRDKRNLFFRLGRSNDATYSYPWNSRTEPGTSFNGADKDITNIKDMFDALSDSIREIKGSTYWFELSPITLAGSFRATGLSTLVGVSSNSRFYWSGTELAITDDSGTPSDSDVIAYLRLFDSTANISLTRQQGLNAIAINDGEILWIELPDPLASFSYDSVGVAPANYRVSARGSVPLTDKAYWLAYREGNKLYLRGLGEMDAGEAREINDETPESLQNFLGFDPETASSIPYTNFPTGLLPYTFTTADTLVDTISANTGNINYVNNILENSNPYDEPLVVVAGAPADDNEIGGPVTAGTNINLPLDSRDSNSTEYYVVGKGQLEVYLNGNYLTVGDDWLEVGTVGNNSSIIQINIDLAIGDRLTFRSDAIGGIISTSGGTTSLQDAYNNGSAITTAVGIPFTVGGAATKVAVFNGDIDVTGVIDPKGITFDPQAANPLSASQSGLWVENVDNALIYSRPSQPDVNIVEIASGNVAAKANEINFLNLSGSPIAKLTPVRIDVAGGINTINVSNEAEALAIVGLVRPSSIADSSSGQVVTGGILEDVTTTALFGDILYVSKTGGVTTTKPSIGSGGFVAGDFVIRLGVIAKDVTNPAQKNLIVNITIVGQL